jgi:uncharacterized protein
MRALNLNGSKEWDEHEIQLYRLAALLHDVGHYPFSHAMEHVLQDHYKAQTYLTGGRLVRLPPTLKENLPSMITKR